MSWTVANPSRILELDGIRGIAILLVVFQHYITPFVGPLLPGLGSLNNVFALAWSGVDLFFVLSGFLIGGILLDAKDSSNYFKVFYIRRVCRTFPLYFAWLFLYLIILLFLPNALQKFGTVFEGSFPIWSYFTFTQNIYAGLGYSGPGWLGITWSLAVEEQFYLLLPILIRFAPKRYLWVIVLGFVLMAPVLRVLVFLHYPHSTIANYFLLPSRIDTLMIGVLCAMAIRNNRVKLWLELRAKDLYLLFAILLGGIVLMASENVTNVRSFDMALYGYTWLALFYALLLLIAISEQRGMIKAIANFAPLRKLGIVAYGVYLFHEGVNGIMFGLFFDTEPTISNIPEALTTVLSFGLTVLLAYVSWRFFEKPIVKMGHRLIYQKNAED